MEGATNYLISCLLKRRGGGGEQPDAANRGTT